MEPFRFYLGEKSLLSSRFFDIGDPLVFWCAKFPEWEKVLTNQPVQFGLCRVEELTDFWATENYIHMQITIPVSSFYYILKLNKSANKPLVLDFF